MRRRGSRRAGKKLPVAQLGDCQLHVTGLGGEQPGPAAVAMGGAGGAALEAAGTDHLISFQLDEGLQHELHRLPQEVQVTARAQGVEQLGQSRLVEGHRVVSPS